MSDLHPHHEDHPRMILRATRRGLLLFASYSMLYAGFILLNIFAPSYMGSVPQGQRFFAFEGLNFALVYGLGLVISAILMAFVYMRLTRRPR